LAKSVDKPDFTATMMASVPYLDMEEAVHVILDNFPEAPCLPVLSRSMKHMLEGIPCLVLDRERRQVLLDPSPEREQELIEFYDRYEAVDLDYFATTPKTAPGFYALLEELKERRPPNLKWVAFQNAGPVLLADVLKQPDGNPSFHNETLRDMLTKAVNMKSRWLERKIKQELPGVEVIAGLAETTLVNFTSAGGSGSRKEIIDAINGGFEGLDCTAWVHCCANIDWTLLTESNVDVINFDAYQHTDKVALYAEEFKTFLKHGGMLAWGMVPVMSDLLVKETPQTLIERLEQGIRLFVSKGIEEELLASSSWLMPCCETIIMEPELSTLSLKMTKEISHKMRNKYRFSP
jgi:hypothetical protein